MSSKTQSKSSFVSIPVTLSQIAEGLRRLSKKDLDTLDLLFDRKAAPTIQRSITEAEQGKLREL